MEDIDTGNYQIVGIRGEEVIVMLPKTRMTKQEALLHAAWLVSVADDNDEFMGILGAVRNT